MNDLYKMEFYDRNMIIGNNDNKTGQNNSIRLYLFCLQNKVVRSCDW